MTRLARFIPLFVTALVATLQDWTIQGNQRTCRYEDYAGRSYYVTQSAAKLCAQTLKVEGG
jgi:hypothetical protein